MFKVLFERSGFPLGECRRILVPLSRVSFNAIVLLKLGVGSSESIWPVGLMGLTGVSVFVPRDKSTAFRLKMYPAVAL